jgi:integrase
VFVHAPEHVRRVVILGSQMGMRVGPSELFGLMWSDVDVENKVIHLRAAQKNKAEPVRDIPIRQSLVEELKAWQEVDRAKRVASVIHYGGKPVKCIHGAWHRTLLRAGIQRRIRPYDLRHAFVTEAIAAGVDIGTVGKLVGHANLTMILKHYQHVLSSQKRAAVEAIPEPQYVAKNMWQSESTPENIKQ